MDLLVEVLFECLELVFSQYTALPPRLNEPKAVAHQLRESGRNTKQTYPKALVLDA